MAETAHAAQLASEGLGKSDVRRRIFDLTLKPVKQFAGQLPKDTRGDELGSLLDGPDTLLPLAREPEDLDIIVAGAGAAGAHSLVMPSFGNTRTVSRAITCTPPQARGPRGSAWRRGWDSNPRYAEAHDGFQDRSLKPLGHPSTVDPRFRFRRRLPGHRRQLAI